MAPSIFKLRFPFILASGSPRRRELLSWLGFDFTIRAAQSESKARPGEAPLDYALRAAAEKAAEILAEAAGPQQGPASAESVPANAPPSPETCRGNSSPLPPNAPVVLGADTIVVLNGKIFGKPGSHAEAHATLRQLAGQTHEVITACCLLLPPRMPACGAESASGGKGRKTEATRPSETRNPGAPQSTPDTPQPTPGTQARFSMPFMDESSHTGGYTMLRFAQSSRVSMWDCPDDVLLAYAASEEPMDKAGAYAVQGHGGFLIRAIEGSWSSVVGLPVAELTQILLAREVIHA